MDVDIILKNPLEKDKNNWLADILNYYQETPPDAETALKKVAGYQLYIELVLNGDFPKNHIIFCSNHINQLTELQKAFNQAKVQLPDHKIFDKSPNQHELYDWIKARRHKPLPRPQTQPEHSVPNNQNTA